MQIISVINQKGGVGKTTTVINLAAGLSQIDKKILVIDLDPQGNATTGLGLSNMDNSSDTIYGVLNGTREISDVIKKTKFENLDKEPNVKKSYFEILYTTIVKVEAEIQEKKELEKIILCDVQNKIYPDLENALLTLLHNSGYPNVNFEKKVNFEELYSRRFN